MMNHHLALPFFAVASLALSGCAAMFDSSASSASIASSSASMSAIWSNVDSPYHDDVRMAAAASAESGAESAGLLRNVSQVAADHGIADWEANSATFYAIGEGLRKGGIDEGQLLALAPELVGNNSEAGDLLIKGFRAA